MIGYLKDRSALRAARRRYELERLRSLMEHNQREIDRIERERNAPCSTCVRLGYV